MKINRRLIREMESLLHKQAKIDAKTGVKNIQSNRFIRDCIVGHFIDENIDMNVNTHGWDGILSNGRYFENKNIKVTDKNGCSFGLVLNDMSLDKLNELENGVFISNSFWDEGLPAFLMVGNTRNVRHYIRDSYNPESRNTSKVSMINCIKNGFKFVAVNYKKQEVWDTLVSRFPRISNMMSINDICTEKDIPELLVEMA